MKNKKEIEIYVLNRNGFGSHFSVVNFTNFDELKDLVDELIENLPFNRVSIDLLPNWEVTKEETEKLNKICNGE